jgi:hypothetical protein
MPVDPEVRAVLLRAAELVELLGALSLVYSSTWL